MFPLFFSSPKHFIHEHGGAGIKWRDAILRGYNLIKPLREQHRWSGGDYASTTYSLFHFAHIILAERETSQLIALTSLDAQATDSILYLSVFVGIQNKTDSHDEQICGMQRNVHKMSHFNISK